MTDICIHCGTKCGGGYCWRSPDGIHWMDDAGPDYIDPDNCCHQCGVELSQGEIDGFIEHICGPERVKAYQAFLESDDEDAEWDYRG